MSAATRAELNISVQRRVEHMELNLERWRWLPQDLGKRYIIANIPSFHLKVVEDDSTLLSMRIIVGRIANTTPVFNDMLCRIILNPYWNVPHKIAAEEILPLAKRDRSYISRENLRLFRSDGRTVDPATVNWSAITASNFPFHLRQEPGSRNALGRIKFVFLNKSKIYMHDTPTRQLFDKPQRSFSHGCIRIEKPMDLAVYLLRNDTHWNRDTIQSALKKAVNLNIPCRNRCRFTWFI